MLEKPTQTLRAVLALGFASEEAARMLINDFGYSAALAHTTAREAARALQEEDIEFVHTVIEHEAAIAAEWRR
jgi:hypothetical protein